jgi:hypothetical protein
MLDFIADRHALRANLFGRRQDMHHSLENGQRFGEKIANESGLRVAGKA